MSHDAPPIEPLLREVRKLGLMVNNLFQRNDGAWQANLRSRDAHTFYEFGCGPDAAGALESALIKVENGKKSPGVVSNIDQAAGEIPADAASDEDLIG